MSRKQREVLQREELILLKTRDLLLDRGYHGLTMDRVAEAIEYSKGTVYQHFGCKEEILSELALRAHIKRNDMFKRASAFKGRARERLVALGEANELFTRVYPDDMRLLLIIKTDVISPKVSEARRERLRCIEYFGLDLTSNSVEDAIRSGDLVLPPHVAPHDITFGLWALTDGGYNTILRGVPLEKVGFPQPYESIMKSCETLIDGYGWKPLSTEWDYQKTRREIRHTVLAPEYEMLKKLDLAS